MDQVGFEPTTSVPLAYYYVIMVPSSKCNIMQTTWWLFSRNVSGLEVRLTMKKMYIKKDYSICFLFNIYL